MLFSILAYMVVVFGIINIIRIALFMIGADWHGVSHSKKIAASKAAIFRRPRITVIIPAHNEEKVILRAVNSAYLNNYPYKEILVVNDGSTDKTARLVRQWKRKNNANNVRLITQKNQGKAAALNYGIRLSKGSLICVLDADSTLHHDALENVVPYFKDPNVGIVSSTVKILDSDSPIKLAQKFEYLISYRMKRAQTTFNIEYIVGGLGSTYRRSLAKTVGLYDTDTITEDFDFTMKILNKGKRWKVMYAPLVITFTEPVGTFRQLIDQRFRWKYGRTQVFLKYKSMFFSRNRKFDRRLTLLALPYALYADIEFFLTPILTAFIILLVVEYGNWLTLLAGYCILTTYLLLNLYTEETESIRTKIKLTPYAFLQYPLTYALFAAEYIALIMLIKRSRNIFKDKSDGSWAHVSRSGTKLTPDNI